MLDSCGGEGCTRLRHPSFWLYPAIVCALLLQVLAGCGTGSPASTASSLSAEELIQQAMETAERHREAAVAWIKAEPTMAQYESLRWVSGGGGGVRRMETLDLPGPERVRPWFSAPPWVLTEGAFYFQDPAKAAGSAERRWYKITPTNVLHLAESAEAPEKEQVLAALDQVRFMLWADPLWVIENMEIREGGGSSFAGRIPNPDTFSPALEAARALLEGSTAEWQTPELEPGPGSISANLEADSQGRPKILQYRGPDGVVWDWEFARTSDEVAEPAGAAEWPPSAP